MARVQITWQRTCEYVATIDTAELRELVSQLPGSAERSEGLNAISVLEGEPGPRWLARALAYLISNTETGREWLSAMADDNPDLLCGTGTPEITDIQPDR